MINGVKRLRKEWQNIQNNPDENIILTPLDEVCKSIFNNLCNIGLE
jgi:hypothetical protein